jgi:hypothetical protein
MRAERRLVGAVFGLALACSALEARAYCRTTTDDSRSSPEGCLLDGRPLYWKSLCVGYRLNQDASRQFTLDEAHSIVRQAFAQWTNPGAVCVPSFSAFAQAPTASREVGYDPQGPNENLILFRDEDWGQDAAIIQLTTVSFDRNTGEILDVDSEVNTNQHEFSAAQLRTVMTHELGHFLGLSHSLEPGSIMQPSLDVLERPLPLLSLDDAEGICAIYPESGMRTTTDENGAELVLAASECPPLAVDPGGDTTCGPGSVEHGCSVSAVPARAPASAGFALALCGAALIARRRRR